MNSISLDYVYTIWESVYPVRYPIVFTVVTQLSDLVQDSL